MVTQSRAVSQLTNLLYSHLSFPHILKYSCIVESFSLFFSCPPFFFLLLLFLTVPPLPVPLFPSPAGLLDSGLLPNPPSLHLPQPPRPGSPGCAAEPLPNQSDALRPQQSGLCQCPGMFTHQMHTILTTYTNLSQHTSPSSE